MIQSQHGKKGVNAGQRTSSNESRSEPPLVEKYFMTFFPKPGRRSGWAGWDVGVESDVKTAAHTYGSGLTWLPPKSPPAVDALDAGFRRGTPSQPALVPVGVELRWNQNIAPRTSEATTIMSNPNDPRDASLETKVTFPKSWGRDEAGQSCRPPSGPTYSSNFAHDRCIGFLQHDVVRSHPRHPEQVRPCADPTYYKTNVRFRC